MRGEGASRNARLRSAGRKQLAPRAAPLQAIAHGQRVHVARAGAIRQAFDRQGEARLQVVGAEERVGAFDRFSRRRHQPGVGNQVLTTDEADGLGAVRDEAEHPGIVADHFDGAAGGKADGGHGQAAG